MTRIHRSGLYRLLLLVLFLGLLSACGGGEEPTPTPEPPPPATNTPLPTNTPAPTNTPVPTDTPVPTNTPEPTATPDTAEGFVMLESAEGGYTIMYPGDWFTGEFFGFNIIASSEELLDSPEPGEEGGVALVIAGDTADFGGDDPVTALDTMIEEFDLGEDAEVVEGPKSATIGGQDAATAVINGTSDNGTPLVAYVVAVIKEGRAAIFISATPAETEAEFMPTFKAMAETIEVGQPEIAEGGETGGDLPEPEGFLLYGDTVTGTVVETVPSAWSFIGIEGETIDLTVRPISDDLDVVIDILDESGASILEGEVDEAFDTERIPNLILPITGDYFIVIRGFANSVGDYELTLVEAGSVESNYPSAGTLAYGETVFGSVTVAAPSVWTFSGSAGDIVNITVEPLDEKLDVVVDVVDAAGVTILANGEVDDAFGLEEILGLTLPSSGDYDIFIRGFADSVGDYQLTLSEAGDVSGGEGIIFFGDTVNGTIDSSEASEWGFSGAEGDYVDVTVSPLDEGFDLVVDVLDQSGSSIVPDGPVDVSFDNEYIRVLRLPSSGGYAISVTGFEGATGRYELTLDLTYGGLPGSFIFAADTLEEGDESHAFPFTSLAGETVIAQVDPEDFDVVLGVYNDDSGELLDEIDASTGFEELIFTTPEDGNYFFQVSGFEGETGFYEITLLGSDTVLYELAYDDFVIGRLGDDGFIEYMFSGAAGDTLEITAETEDDIDLILQIVDSDDNVLAEVDDNFSGEPETLSYTIPEDGLIFFRVNDFFEGQGEFTFSVGSG